MELIFNGIRGKLGIIVNITLNKLYNMSQVIGTMGQNIKLVRITGMSEEKSEGVS